jgi:hypothetical protein
VILAGFEHRPGVHCGSTALADALRVQGVDVSEAMAFGLGAGLGFFYVASPQLSPSHQFHGRAVHLERTACEVLGAPARERTEEDPARAWEGVVAALGRGVAPILSTDLAELPYWRTSTRFGGHRIVLAGHDPARGVALVADTDRQGLVELPLDVLQRARASLAPPFPQPGHPWLEIERPPVRRPLAEAVADALRRQARDFLLDVTGAMGASALERWAEELPRWPEQFADERDRAWCFRFGSQIVDKRGTGGGLFRTLYAAFLEEAEREVPGLRALGLSPRMRGLAGAWSALGGELRALSEAPGAPVPAHVAGAARALARDERRYHEDVAALVR